MTDQLAAIRELKEKRKCLPNCLTYFRDGVYAGEVVDCETGNAVDLDHEEMEAFVALANACDAGLLDAAERGLAAESRIHELEQMLSDAESETARLHQIMSIATTSRDDR